jgi:hypothetical protein
MAASSGSGEGYGDDSQPAPIQEDILTRIVGESTVAKLMRMQPGSLISDPFRPRVYNPTYKSGFMVKTTEQVPYMIDQCVSTGRWDELLRQVGDLERQHLAPLAAAAFPPGGCDPCFDQAKVESFAAIAAQIDTTRNLHVARISLQLAPLGVTLEHGGSTSAYYLRGAGGYGAIYDGPAYPYPPTAQDQEVLVRRAQSALQSATMNAGDQAQAHTPAYMGVQPTAVAVLPHHMPDFKQ